MRRSGSVSSRVCPDEDPNQQKDEKQKTQIWMSLKAEKKRRKARTARSAARPDPSSLVAKGSEVGRVRVGVSQRDTIVEHWEG